MKMCLCDVSGMGAIRAMALVVVFAGSVCPGEAWADEGHALAAEGNQAFAVGDYTTARECYHAAAEVLPRSPEAVYNVGVASYMLGDYARARDALNRALVTRDPAFEAKIKFNLGNVACASASKIASNPPEAIELLKIGMGHYRDALELDPDDEDARINIELAQLFIKKLLDKLQQQRKEQQRQRQQQREQQDQGEDEQQQQNRPQGDQQEDGQQDEKQQSDDEPVQEQPQEGAGEALTTEEAERLLQAVRDKERIRREQLARRRHSRRLPVLRDW